jgi:RNA polymerase sigma-70 factor (ECF subfamily)
MSNDQEIIRRIRQGDEKEFESLFRSSYITLVRYAKTILKDHDEAEDVVQDLFSTIWSDREKISIESSLKGYLFRAVHNKCLHRIQHNMVIERHNKEVSVIRTESNDNPAEILNHKELQIRISGILKRLPERCSTIFYMNRFEGLKYAEIAGILSVSVKTVEANMGKALKEFRKALKEQ